MVTAVAPFPTLPELTPDRDQLLRHELRERGYAQFQRLPHEQQSTLYWSVRLAAIARHSVVVEVGGGIRFLAFGLTDEGFGITVYADPAVHARPRELRSVKADGYAFPVFLAPVDIVHHAARVQPVDGTASCWATSERRGQRVGPGILTAKHVTPGTIGSSVPLTDGSLGEVVDIGPEGIDVALVRTQETPGTKRLEVRLVAPWADVEFDGPSGHHVTKVSKVTDPGYWESPWPPAYLVLSDWGTPGDSGAAVRERSSGAVVGIYLAMGKNEGGQLEGLAQHAYHAATLMKLEVSE